MNKDMYICRISDISDPASRSFSIQYGENKIEGFVVHKDGQFYAYRNSCPHTGAPLDWVEHQFLDADAALIQCAVHDARFDIESGLCVAGPCAGNSLYQLKLEIREDSLYLAVAP
jgi:nitrite reductase/ring-hydroxylating ferredoxin subunit